uniref:lipopolysaccharide biosynthesis protein n=1 Tax=Streptomyces flavofungini TaxID=68200 RepID=UPI003F7FE18A
MSDTTTAQAGAAAPGGGGGQPSSGKPGKARRMRLPGTDGGSPLFRNAYALMLNTGISGVLGVGFWLAAARYYSESAVGQGSAAIAAMKLLAGLTAVTLTGALARFIPIAGRATGRLIFKTYAGSSVAVALAAGVFLLTLDLWGPSYRFLHGPVHGVGFILAVVAWSVLTLQDGVLTGLRSALWVPVGNTVFSVAKLGLLIAMAAAIPTAGVFVSWVASIAVSVIPLGWLVFRRLVPRHVRATDGKAQPPTLREIGRFLAGDYTGSLFSLAVVYLVPVIVASQVSSVDNAYFYITTTIGGTVNLLAINMGASLTVEGAHDPALLAANTRSALRRMAMIMLPVCGVLFVGAPFILSLFGPAYADAATPLLRWFAVGALLRVVMETYFAVQRAQSRTSGIAWLQGLLCVLVLGLTLILLPRMGLTGAGIAEISSLAVIVAIAAPKLYRVTRSVPAARTPVETAPDGDLADLGQRDAPTMRIRRPAAPGGSRARGERHGPAWALRESLDSETLQLAVQLDFDHPERRPDVRPGPGTPAADAPAGGTPETPETPGASGTPGTPEAPAAPAAGCGGAADAHGGRVALPEVGEVPVRGRLHRG